MSKTITPAAAAIRRPFAAALSAIAVAFLVVAGTPVPSRAHARLLASTPRDNELLAASPGSVHLWVNEILDHDFNSIEVFFDSAPESDRQSLTAGPAEVDPDNRTHLSVPLQPLRPGSYVVHWKVLSRDGHTARGRFSFRVLPDRDGAY
jgi:copper resistance protein C